MSNLILRTWHQHFLAVSLEDKDYISCYCHRLPDLPKMKLSKNEEFVRYAFYLIWKYEISSRSRIFCVSLLIFVWKESSIISVINKNWNA